MRLCDFFAFLILISISTQAYANSKEETKAPPTSNGEALPSTETLPPVWPAKMESPLALVRFDTQEEYAQGISGLSLLKNKIPVVMVLKDQTFKPMIEIQVQYLPKPGWKLYTDETTLATQTRIFNHFKIYAYLKSSYNELILIAKGPEGTSEKTRLLILAPEAQEYSLVTPWHSLKLSMGLTSMIYQQTGYTDFSSLSTVLMMNYLSSENPGWGFGTQFDLTAFSLQSNSESQYGPQIANGAVQLAYSFKSNKGAKKIWIPTAGFRYSSVFSNGAPFGFSNLLSTEIGLKWRSQIDQKNDYSYEFNYSSLGSLTDFSQRSVIIRISKGQILKNFHRSEWGLHLLDLRFQPTTLTSVALSSASLTYGYSF